MQRVNNSSERLTVILTEISTRFCELDAPWTELRNEINAELDKFSDEAKHLEAIKRAATEKQLTDKDLRDAIEFWAEFKANQDGSFRASWRGDQADEQRRGDQADEQKEKENG